MATAKPAARLDLRCSLGPFEIGRYVLATLCFIFGVTAWGLIADKDNTLSMCGSFPASSDIFKNSVDIPQLPNGIPQLPNDIPQLPNKSPLCAVLIAFGVIMMLALFALMAWHAMIHFGRPFLPYSIELGAFAAMSVLWLILFIASVMTSGSLVRNAFIELRASLACMFMASVFHAGVAAIAFVEMRRAGPRDKAAGRPTHTPAAPQPAAQYAPPPPPAAQYAPPTPPQPPQAYAPPPQQPYAAPPPAPAQYAPPPPPTA